MISCAFPQLFLRGGDMLPTGTWPNDFIKHLMRYYDGRFERNTKFIALLFNQLQRHTAIKRAAKVGISNTGALERFGSLINSTRFREQLVHAKEHPESRATKRLNASLLRVLSLVGNTVPFSPFERASTRPKIAALRCRYEVPQHWVTIAPPEHDDLILQRIAMLRKSNRWNEDKLIFARSTCTFDDFPHDLDSSARNRLAISNQYPALTADVFQRYIRTVFDDVVACSISASVRVSRHFGEHFHGPYGKVAAHCYVVEPQRDGRLHAHALLYGSTYTPELLSRIACSERMRTIAAQWLESVSTTSLHPRVHEWRSRILDNDGRLPRAFEIQLPDAGKDLAKLYRRAEKRIATTNVHVHSSTCFKTARGKHARRLARPAGIHEGPTCPLFITQECAGNLTKGKRGQVTGHPIDNKISEALDRQYDYRGGKLFRGNLPGPLVWELRRPEADKFIVETNRTLAALSHSHTNSSIINGEDAGDVVEQYQQNYMTKDGQSLQGGVSVLLSAIDHINKYPSRAEDRETDIRHGKYAAARTIVHVKRLVWYILPHQLVSRLTKKMHTEESGIDGTDGFESAGDQNSTDVASEIEDLVAMANNDSHHIDSNSVSGRAGGTRAYRVGDSIVFLSQVDSYIHRGKHFEEYSPLEFECIVDVLPISTTAESVRGRKRRIGFPFAKSHPLSESYHGFIRTKQHTPIFGGAPPPIWKDSSVQARRATSRYMLAAFTSWSELQMPFSFDEQGLLKLCSTWDNSEAPLIYRQRYRYIRNLLKRGHRNSKNEQMLTDWRNRNVDIWKEMKENGMDTQRSVVKSHRPEDAEQLGLLNEGIDIYALTQATISGSARKRSELRAIRLRLESVMDPEHSGYDTAPTAAVHTCDASFHGHYAVHHEKGIRLRDVASRVASLTTPNSDIMKTRKQQNQPAA